LISWIDLEFESESYIFDSVDKLVSGNDHQQAEDSVEIHLPVDLES
jgi:hypothetical protein